MRPVAAACRAIEAGDSWPIYQNSSCFGRADCGIIRVRSAARVRPRLPLIKYEKIMKLPHALTLVFAALLCAGCDFGVPANIKAPSATDPLKRVKLPPSPSRGRGIWKAGAIAMPMHPWLTTGTRMKLPVLRTL